MGKAKSQKNLRAGGKNKKIRMKWKLDLSIPLREGILKIEDGKF